MRSRTANPALYSLWLPWSPKLLNVAGSLDSLPFTLP